MKKVKTLFKVLAQDLRNNLGHLHYFKVGVQKPGEGQLFQVALLIHGRHANREHSFIFCLCVPILAERTPFYLL